MDELQERNPFITGEMMREFKHYQFLNKESYNRLVGFIYEAVEFMRGCDKMYEFDVKYCRKFGLSTDEDMFYKA